MVANHKWWSIHLKCSFNLYNVRTNVNPSIPSINPYMYMYCTCIIPSINPYMYMYCTCIIPSINPYMYMYCTCIIPSINPYRYMYMYYTLYINPYVPYKAICTCMYIVSNICMYHTLNPYNYTRTCMLHLFLLWAYPCTSM